MPDLPSGTISFLLTDVEGSTRLWEQYRDGMEAALARHDALLTAEIERLGGVVVKSKGEGDSFFAVFARATDAVAAATSIQLALASQSFPLPSLRIRMALHTGEAELRDNDYYGATVNRCARLRSIAHGGQVLLSQATAELVRDLLPAGVSLRPLGAHRLKDLQRPEQVYQLVHADLLSEFPPLRSLDALSHNLPVQINSFVGRERDTMEVGQFLAAARMVTLTGPGGCGKTRLSLQVAADALEEYPDGVWLVELAGLTDPALVPQAVASALDVREQANRPLLSTLIDHLKSQKALLLLDNCEHLLEACSSLASALLTACPDLRILATSRENLGVPGEITRNVPSLSLPEPRRHLPAQDLMQSEAGCLFVDRARLVMPGFQLTDENALAVAQICHRLDGIPLALELAAAWVRVLSVEQINARLDDCFQLLTRGNRTALPRHKTLRAAVEWSYDLLSEPECILFNRLSVFAGRFSLEGAEAVCGGEGVAEDDILDILASLVEKSLVAVEEGAEGPGRYHMLQTLAQYGRERLQASGAEGEFRRRHAAYFLTLAEEAGDNLVTGPQQAAWLDQLEQEHDNLRAALGWSLENNEIDTGLRLGAALYRFWFMRGHFSEGRDWLRGLLNDGPETPPLRAVRAEVLNGAGILADTQGDYQEARSLYEQSLGIFRELDDRLGIARMLGNLGIVAYLQGEYHRARSLYEECSAIFRELNYRLGLANVLSNLGIVAREQGDFQSAQALVEDSLNIFRELADSAGIARQLYNLGMVASDQGRHETARSLYQESLSIRLALGDRLGIALLLEALACHARADGQPQRALRLAAAASSLRLALGAPLPPAEQVRLDRDLEQARQALTPDAVSAAWGEGESMTLEHIVAYASGQAAGSLQLSNP